LTTAGRDDTLQTADSSLYSPFMGKAFMSEVILKLRSRGTTGGRNLIRGGAVLAVGLLLGGGLGAAPLQPTDWRRDPEDGYGGRSVIENGAMTFWTELPLAPSEEDEDDLQIWYYRGFVPRSGPYSLQARVRLPETLFAPHDPDADQIPLYTLGLVASGLEVADAEEKLPVLRATVVYADLAEFGVSRGDVVVIWKEQEDGAPRFVRLAGAPHLLDLKIAYDGIGEVGMWYKQAEEDTWHLAGTQAVRLRDGSDARAGIGGQSGNLLVPRGQGGAIVDFQMQCTPPRITSLEGHSWQNTWTIRWETEPGATYSVWGSADLRAWEPVGSSVVGTGQEAFLMHHPGAPESHYFYRVQRE
jgi:hypothetical protein